MLPLCAFQQPRLNPVFALPAENTKNLSELDKLRQMKFTVPPVSLSDHIQY